VRADIDVAAQRIGRAVWTSRLATLALAAVAIAYALGDDDPWAALAAVASGLVILALTEGLKRGSQLAAGALLVSYVGAVTAAYVSLGRPSGLLAALIVAYRLFDGLRGAIDLADLRVEYAQVYKPREPQAGDVYSITRAISSSHVEYEHLPMDLSAFLAWEPELLRAEPVLPDELRGYESWLRVHGAVTPR